MSSKTEVLSFNEWAKFQGLPLEKDENGLYVNRHTHYARKGWEAKPKQDDVEELQKRIDLALKKCYTGIRKQGGDYYLELVQDILKGACNEEE